VALKAYTLLDVTCANHHVPPTDALFSDFMLEVNGIQYSGFYCLNPNHTVNNV